MTAFGRFPDRGLKSLATEAVAGALRDSRIPAAHVGYIYFSNVAAGILQGQESTRGQHALRNTELHAIPLVNVENACASGSTAVHQAWLAVASGLVDVAIAVGVEKLYSTEREQSLAALHSALDQDRIGEIDADLGGDRTRRSIFMDLYARLARQYMESTGATADDFAAVAVKNHEHGSLNAKAQYGRHYSVEEVLAAPSVIWPLTRPMCAPISDGAGALVLTTPDRAAQHGIDAIHVKASVLGGGREGEHGQLVPHTAARAYEMAAIPPCDIDIVECHDATAPGELILCEELQLCSPGEAVKLLRDGSTRIGGQLPINPSGGLESRGHPLGATGIAQLVELTDQLRGRCFGRQVHGARTALAENSGGYLGPDVAVSVVTILSR
jgi:acetyl-CoA acetyltransferase